MQQKLGSKTGLQKDHLGALVLILLGAAVIWSGLDYRMGELNRMGPGFIPVVLGVLLMLVGLALGLTTPLKRTAPAPPPDTPPATAPLRLPDVRAVLCILAGIAAFVLLGDRAGMVPATFAVVFISALGDRNNSWRGAALLALGVTLFGVAVFHYGLSLPLPLFGTE